MFLVLSHTDEYAAADANLGEIDPDSDIEAWNAALEAMKATQQYRCRKICRTETNMRAAVHDGDIVAALFTPRGREQGKFVVYMGDDGWFSGSAPRIAIGIATGMFNTREQAAEWANTNGGDAGWVFELTPTTEAVAA